MPMDVAEGYIRPCHREYQSQKRLASGNEIILLKLQIFLEKTNDLVYMRCVFLSPVGTTDCGISFSDMKVYG